MSIDIDSLSTKELATLISKAKKRRTTLAKRKPITQVRKRLNQLAKTEGYTIAELFGAGAGTGTDVAVRAPRGPATKKARKSLGKVAPKYRNPNNPSETWTGRGRQPLWLVAFTENGRNRDEFLINPEPTPAE